MSIFPQLKVFLLRCKDRGIYIRATAEDAKSLPAQEVAPSKLLTQIEAYFWVSAVDINIVMYLWCVTIDEVLDYWIY
jgi:hypothetical protein